VCHREETEEDKNVVVFIVMPMEMYVCACVCVCVFVDEGRKVKKTHTVVESEWSHGKL